jgi:histidine triad (HIT) family protein
MEKDCVFCQIIRGEKPADFLYEDKSVVAFKDIHPHAPIHILIVPREHIRSVNDLTEQDRDVVSEMILNGQGDGEGTFDFPIRV